MRWVNAIYVLLNYNAKANWIKFSGINGQLHDSSK
jgi:hypothetical protein